MRGRRSYQSAARSGNHDVCVASFVTRVHQLLQLGYERLKPSDYATEEEPAITGDLGESIESVLEFPAEEWMRFFRVHDDPPENEPKSKSSKRRKGKRRRRVDLKLDCSETSPYQRFRFEAKRLGPGNSAKTYVGEDGIGMFLRGRYGSSDPYGGGLAYIQSLDESKWAERIAAEFAGQRGQFKFTADGAWTVATFPNGPQHIYTTRHRRPGNKPIRIYHTLLPFLAVS